ncbi:Histone acetyltransferase complex subunit [Komagataella phaffii CBS 7435]|nr:Histone acetyltransferase complex subunit [Komagataella phaffii CBS 7435]CCA38779.1 Histone acetyltransferase complex subunit [Komagataella phaffii CBS 7435]
MSATEITQQEEAKITFEIHEKYRQQEKIINEEFKIWKKSVPLLYNFIYTSVTQWPNLSADWLTSVKQNDQSFTVQFVVGSNSSSDEDYLALYQIDLPLSVTTTSAEQTVDEEDIKKAIEQDSKSNKFQLVHKWPHPGEINKLAFNSDNLVATVTKTGSILVFDINNVSSSKPKFTLNFHKQEGFALQWNPSNNQQLVTGANDGKIAVWDLSKNTTAPVQEFSPHSSSVNEVSWNSEYNFLIGSASDDRSFQIHDLRSGETIIKVDDAHNGDVNAIKFHPVLGDLLVTAGQDTLVKVWSLSKLLSPADEPSKNDESTNDEIQEERDQAIRYLHGHFNSVTQVDFNPENPNYLLSSSCLDKRVMVWNLANLDEDFEEDEAEKNPEYNDPALIFIHGGHTSSLSEARWHPTLHDVILSCGEDNLLEVWQPLLPREEDSSEEDEKIDENEQDEVTEDKEMKDV